MEVIKLSNEYKEAKTTGLLMATDELRKLIVENPNLPLLVFVGEDATSDYYYTACGRCTAYIGEFLDCIQEVNNERCYMERDTFEEDLSDFYYNLMYNDSNSKQYSESEFERFIDEKLKEYEPYWKKCIILFADN